MFNWLTDITSIFIVLPIAVFTVVACFITYIFKRPRYAFKIACDFSTIFLILAVHLFMKLLFGKSFLLYILLFLFLIGIALIFMFAKRDGEIHIKRTIRVYWRICFFVFSLLYILLFLIGLIMGIAQVIG